MLTNSQYKEIFHLSPLPTVLLSLKESVFMVAEANNAYLDNAKTKSEDIQGENFLDWIESQNRKSIFHQSTSQIKKSLSEVLITGKPNSVKLEHIDIQNTPIFDQKGNIEFIVHIFKPLLVHNDSEKLLSSIITKTEEAFIVVNEDLLIISFNEKFNKLYQIYFGVEVALGDSILSYAKPDRRIALKKLYRNVFSGKKEYSTVDIAHQGETKKLSLKYNPITDDQQDVVGIFITVADDTEVKKFESQLKTRENKLSIIFNNLAEIVFLIGVEENKRFKFIAINKAFTQISGFNEDQVIGKYAEEFIAEPYLNVVLKNYNLAVLTKSNVNWEQTTLYASGEKTDHISITPIFDDDGNCIELIGLVTDITERFISSKLLQESEQRFKNLVQEGSDMIGILDLAGTYKYVSPTSMTVLGKLPEELIGKNALNFIHPDDAEKVFSNLSKVGVEKRVAIQPFRFMHSDGTWHWLETIATDMLDEPSIKGIVTNSRDVTGKIAAQKEILLSNERYKLVTQATSDAIWDWDFITDKIYWGEGFQLLFGYNPDELTSNTEAWTAKIHPQDIKRISTSIKAFIDSEENNWVGEYRYLNSNGTYNYVLDKGVLIRDESGKAIRMVGSLQDISQRKKEEQQLKLLESVITNTNDSIIITEAEPIEGDGPRILYVNDAFTRLTGYAAEEVIGKTPRILQGPKTNRLELERLKTSLRNWESCEITVVNYKKNGEEFWINMSISPVSDEKGWFTHWISIERDVTEQKNQEIQKILLTEITQLFNTNSSITDILNNTLQTIIKIGDYAAAEIWLVDNVKQAINLTVISCADESIWNFNELTKHQTSFKFGEGAAGKVWESQTLEYWNLNHENCGFIRAKAAQQTNLINWVGLPLFSNDAVSGVLILGYNAARKVSILSKNFGKFLGAEIKRKQLELELDQLFNFAPDIIATSNFDGYFKKINPAACQLLEYSIDEFLSQPLLNFIHPEDRENTVNQFKAHLDKSHTYYYENRYLTKSGRIKWLGWSSNTLIEEGLIFSVAKDITEEKNLTALLVKSNSLGKVGSWEIDIISENVYWSDITREILETEPGFTPSLATGTHYFREGRSKETITKKLNECNANGSAWDEDLQIITFKGNTKWIRTIGQAEIVNGKCIRIYGSFQDIDERKKNEIKVRETLSELEESEKRYSDLFHLSPLPNWVFDVETLKFLDVNKAAISHYGYSYDEFLTMTIKDIRPVEELGKLEEVLKRNIKNKIFHSEGIYTHQNKKGVKLTVEIKSSYITYKGKKAKVIVANDITERVSYLKAVEDQNKKLQEISWIQSHDIRAPLARLMGLMPLLDNITEQAKGDADMIINYITQSAEELDDKIKEIVKKSGDKA